MSIFPSLTPNISNSQHPSFLIGSYHFQYSQLFPAKLFLFSFPPNGTLLLQLPIPKSLFPSPQTIKADVSIHTPILKSLIPHIL